MIKAQNKTKNKSNNSIYQYYSSGILIFQFLGIYSHEHHLPLQHPFPIIVPMLLKRCGQLPVRWKNLLQRRWNIIEYIPG